MCDKFMCFKAGNSMTNLSCVVDYHNECFYGLARSDHGLRGVQQRSWRYPTSAKMRSNAKMIRDYRVKAIKEKEAMEDD